MVHSSKQVKEGRNGIKHKNFINFQNSHFQKMIKDIIQNIMKWLKVSEIYLEIFDEVLLNTHVVYPDQFPDNRHFKQKKIIENGLKLLIPLLESKTHAFTKVKQEEKNIYYIFKTYPSQIHGLLTVNKKVDQKFLTIDDQEVYLNFMPIFELIELNCVLNKKSNKRRQVKKESKHELLKNRALELRSFYEASNKINATFKYHEILSIAAQNLHHYFKVAATTVFLSNFHIQDGEVMIYHHPHLEKENLNRIRELSSKSIKIFSNKVIDEEKIENHIVKLDLDYMTPCPNGPMCVLANVPLVFKGKIMGILLLFGSLSYQLSPEEFSFLNLVTNQFVTNLGRLKKIEQLYQLKFLEMLNPISDGFISFDENFKVEFLNEKARRLFGISRNETFPSEHIDYLLKLVNTQKCAVSTKKSGKKEIKVYYQNLTLKVSFFYVKNIKTGQYCLNIVLKDLSECQYLNKVQENQLSIIEGLNKIVKSATDFNHTLNIVLDFLLRLFGSGMGSIQLKEGHHFYTKIHSNFPDKIRKMYTFSKSLNSISDNVIESKKMIYIPSYPKDLNLNQKAKVTIQSYLCIPIVFQKKLIGIINLVSKNEEKNILLNQKELETFSTISDFLATIFHSHLMHKGLFGKNNENIDYMHELQNRLITKSFPEVDEIQISGLSIPAKEIGGDYYDTFILDESRIGVILIDIVGKGFEAAMTMALLKSIVTYHVPKFFSPKEVLSDLNKRLIKDVVLQKFVALFYGVFDIKTKTLTYCNAGLNTGVLIRKKKSYLLKEGTSFPLGVFEDEKYEENKLILKENDFLVLCTDGVFDIKNPKGKKFSRQHIQRVIKENIVDHPRELIKKIYASILDFSQNTLIQKDDISMIMVKFLKEFKLRTSKSSLENQSRFLNKLTYTISSDKVKIKEMRTIIEEIAKKMRFDSEKIHDIKLAVNEAHANIIEHAYNGRSDQVIVFEIFIFENKLEICIMDTGPKIDQKILKTKGKNLIDLEGSGYGVFLIKTLMDDVLYENIGDKNRIKLIKFLN